MVVLTDILGDEDHLGDMDLKEGDRVKVKVLDIDGRGKIRLS